MREHFDVWCYWKDSELDKLFPHPAQPTTRKFLVSQEPDEDVRGKSVRKVDMDGKIGITLRERLLMELEYFQLTGKHLDVKGITFCSGSSTADGDVPGVLFSSLSSEVCVNDCSIDSADPSYGIRRAVA